MPHPLNRAAVALVVVCVGALAAAAAALACSCIVATESENLAQATTVFAGTVVASADPNAGGLPYSSADPIEWTFRVDAVVKGEVGAEQRVTSARDSASCGYDFEVGARYLVLAYRDEEGRLATGLCGGTRPLAADEAVPELGPPGVSVSDALQFRRFPIHWLGYSFDGRGIGTITRAPGQVSVRYGDMTVTTTRKCATPPDQRLAPPTGRRRLAGMIAGFRAGALVVFAGRQEIRIAGPPGLYRTAVGALEVANPGPAPGAGERPLAAPAPGVATMADCTELAA